MTDNITYYYLEQNGNVYSEADISKLIGSAVLSYSTLRKNSIGLYFAQYITPIYNKYTELLSGYTWVKYGIKYIQTWNIVPLTGIELTNATNNAKRVVANEIQRRLDEILAWSVSPDSREYYQEYINELIALPTQPIYPVQLAIDVDNGTFNSWPVAPQVLGAVETLETSSNSTTATVQDVYTVVSTDSNIYGSSIQPVSAPNNTSGWNFTNSTGSQQINWLLYANSNTATAQQFGSLTSIWTIIEYNNTTSQPYFMIYSQPTGSGDVAPQYHSVWEYNDYLVPPPSAGKYLVYWGEDPNVRRDLPRINITQVQGTNSDGDRATTEALLSFSLVTDNAGVGDQNFTVMSSGYIIGGRVAVTNYVAL